MKTVSPSLVDIRAVGLDVVLPHTQGPCGNETWHTSLNHEYNIISISADDCLWKWIWRLNYNTHRTFLPMLCHMVPHNDGNDHSNNQIYLLCICKIECYGFDFNIDIVFDINEPSNLAKMVSVIDRRGHSGTHSSLQSCLMNSVSIEYLVIMLNFCACILDSPVSICPSIVLFFVIFDCWYQYITWK